MKRIAGLAALLGGVAVAPSAMAQDSSGSTGLYWSAGYTLITADDGFGGEADIGAVQGKLGYRFHPNFGIEGEAAFGVADQSYDVGGTPVDVGLDREWGAFGVAFLPISPGFDLFARAGFADMQLEASSGGISVSAGDTGTGFGAGANLGVGGFNLRAEYTRYEFDGGGADTFGISIGGKF